MRYTCVFFTLLVAWLLPEMPVAQAGSITTASPKDGAVIRLDCDTVDLGAIAVLEVDDNTGRLTLTVHNDGKAPLILRKVEGCCGTNITDYTKEPILPGKTGSVSVYFRVEPKPQSISRTVTIHSNAGNTPVAVVRIVGTVIIPKEKGRL
jgi:hypothetical protein